MLYQCLGPLICNDIAYCLLLLSCQRCSNAAWLARDGCAHPWMRMAMQVRTVHARVTACAHPPAYTPPIFSPRAKGGRGRGRRGKVDGRQRSCATHNAMPKLHFAAPGAICIHFLALSSSYCIWSRLCALLAQLVHHSNTTAADMFKLAHIGTVWGNPARRRFPPIYDIILI